MKSTFKRTAALLLGVALMAGLCACKSAEKEKSTKELYPNAAVIELDGKSATIDGTALEEFDYTWHCDPSTAHDDVKDAPAEYYTGTKPETDAAAYIDSELYYYPKLDESGFKQVNYDGENEWAYYYTDGKHNDYIFATLPNKTGTLPTQMMHTEEEAGENRVLHITKPGEYILQGNFNGQIRVDLGEADDVFTDPDAKVTLILDNADIKCTVAPAVIYTDLYECDNAWENADEHTADVDTAKAGAVLVIPDGTENTVDGNNIFRMLKTKYKNEDSTDAVKVQKKMRKNDAALYSLVTMNINGGNKNTGKLTVTSGLEGISSDLHLALNGGVITVNSQDDGINTSEDNVSVCILNGADVTLNPGQGAEGDGVDSNGFIVLNGGSIAVNGVRPPDSALDSDKGITYNGGTVTIDGEKQFYTAGTTFRESGRTNKGGMTGEKPQNGFAEDFDLKEFKEKVAALPDDATADDVFSLLHGARGNGMPNDGNQPPEMQNGEQPPEPPQNNQ